MDAPCSGIGLIRRKPDIKYNKESADFVSLQAIQLAILDSVCQSVRKGGIIVYSTCTIMGKENFEVVDQFLKNHPNFEQVPLDHERKDILKMIVSLLHPNYMEVTASLSVVLRESHNIRRKLTVWIWTILTDVGQRRTNNQDYANQYKNKAGKSMVLLA